MKLKISGFVVLSALAFLSAAGASADYPVAGVQPDRRPEGAPRITGIDRNQDWYAHALRGVSQPYPKSLYFLEHQGNWYTPFNRPGMPGVYDIRGLHAD